ncbi:hypothetical protein [Streptomyces noursei]|nr:hypothetical protein [Streptomyces noursei]QRX94843.1 hypothetical protein JNO44_31985 [Streptomyces noursei]
MRLGTTMGGRYRLTRGPLRGGMCEVRLATRLATAAVAQLRQDQGQME